MAADGWVPEIVVGIDFGMTCTGEFANPLARAWRSASDPSAKMT